MPSLLPAPKAQQFRQRLLLTASVFRLDRTNIKTTDPNDPTALLNLGEQRTDGAELNGEGELTRIVDALRSIGLAAQDGDGEGVTLTPKGIEQAAALPPIAEPPMFQDI